MEDIPHLESPPATERLAYSIQVCADMLGVNYFSVYRLIQRGKLEACKSVSGRVLTGPAINSINNFDAPNAVDPQAFNGATLADGILSVELPAKSVVVLEVL